MDITYPIACFGIELLKLGVIMEINLFNSVSSLIAIITFGWALLERSKRLPLWHIIKGLEQSAMSNLALYDEIRKQYKDENRETIPLDEFVAHIDNAKGHWHSHWELIKGIRYSIDSKIKDKEK